MKSFPVWAAVALGVVVAVAACTRKTGVTEPAGQPVDQSAGQSTRPPPGDTTSPTTTEDAGVMVVRKPRIQGVKYRSGELEAYEYIDGYNSGVNEDEVVAYATGGVRDRLTLTKVGEDEVDVGGHIEVLKVYSVRRADGGNPCENEYYVADDDELADVGCDAGTSVTCTALERLQQNALVLKGTWSDGGWSTPSNKWTLSCSSGATAKCAHWGYVPGATHDSGVSLDDYYAACVHAVRAKYTSTDQSYTCPHTRVDMFDRLNIHRRGDGGSTFESLWSRNGVKCVERPRYGGCSIDTTECGDPAPTVGAAWALDSIDAGLIGVYSDVLDAGCPTSGSVCL